MARTLSGTLTTEMNAADRSPAAQVTVERWLPEWTARVSGLSGGQTEQYAHGHSLAVATDGNGAGEDILFRARSGSAANPQDGKLYVAVIKGANLAAPANWDTLWADSGRTGLMYPAWTANSGAAHGGSLACVAWDNAGTPMGRVFYMKATGSLCVLDVNLSSGAIGSETVIASLGTGAQLASMQLAACAKDEVFVLLTQLVEAGLAAWHVDVYGSFIRRYSYSGSWAADNSFHFLTHAEGGLLRDTPLEDNDFGDTSCTGVTAQWGKRFCGGLAALQIDSNTALVSLGLTFWRRWGYYTHSQGVMSFIYHRDSGWWQRGVEAGEVSFTEETRLNYDVLARGCGVDGNNFIVWNRFTEPGDYTQTPTSLSMPRIEEVVYARLSADGQYLTEYQYLGNPDELSGAALAAINHAGGKALYAIGWRSVYESPPAAFVCSVDSPENLEASCNSYSLNVNNRRGMTLDIGLVDPAPLFDSNSDLKARNLARAYYGIAGELVQVGQGFVDTTNPSLSVNPDGQFDEGALVHCRADDLLLKTRAQTLGDVIPQTVVIVPPDVPIRHVSASKGVWQVEPMQWPTKFFAGQYDALQGQPCWRLISFPPAQTGADLLKDRYGTWFKDITWLEMPAMVDGAIEASLRFGDPYNQSNFTVPTSGGTLTGTISRSNGVITQIQWTGPGGYNNTVKQSAVMGGLLCHAPEVGRKYAFVWECNSNFSTSSHTDDTWRNENFDRADYSSHSTGSNRLYLIVSDYDGGNWVHKSVQGITATGLTTGKPADLRMQVLGGKIYCFYRAHSTGAPNQWRLAFAHNAARFGAGQFGLVGRGHAGIVWESLKQGENKIARTVNVVDFWNIKLTDAVMDRTMEEHLARLSWRGFTATQFNSTAGEASRTVNAGTSHAYAPAVENLVIDFKVSIPASGNEAGVYVRGVASGTPTAECIKLGLVASSTANSAAAVVNYYLVKRYFSGGVENAAAREYSPVCVQLQPGKPVPVRVTVRNALYSVWVAGNLAGMFVDDTELGLYFGLYAEGGNAVFSSIRAPELYEVPTAAPLAVNQAMGDAINALIGRRRIKAIFDYLGRLKFSYYESRASGPAFTQDKLWLSSLQRNPRYISRVRVQGANNAYAEYQATLLAARGQRFELVTNQDITLREFAYREARLIVAETAERQEQATFEGQPDLRVEPEDEVNITVSRQGISGGYVVDDIGLEVQMGDAFDSRMRLSARQTVAL